MGMNWPLDESLDDARLERRLFPAPVSSRVPRPLPGWSEVHRELRGKGVTLALLWQEYKAVHPEGLQYRRFCEQYRVWTSTLAVVMRLLHRHGRIHVLALRDLGEPAPDDYVGLSVLDLLAIELDGAGPYRQKSGDCLQQGRLAGPVAAEKSDDTAFRHGHGDTTRDVYLAVSDLEVANGEHAGSSC